MGEIGFTTGCFCKSGIPIEDIIRHYLPARSDSVELSFSKPSELLGFEPSKAMIADAMRFSFVSIHAPWKEVTYSSDDNTARLLKKLGYLSDIFGAKGIVLHPDRIQDFGFLQDSGLPFLIENMDHRKSFGTMPKHIEELKRSYDFDFVFDVQHAYEHDPTMRLAEEMLSIMGNRLKHIHVSGQTAETNHSLVHMSDNKEEIMRAISSFRTPIILEGIISGKDYKCMDDEIDLMMSLHQN